MQLIQCLFFTGTDITGPPSYTVTSPRASVDNTAAGTADFIRHTVKPTADFKPQATATQADHTVLLKLRQGDEYKLVSLYITSLGSLKTSLKNLF